MRNLPTVFHLNVEGKSPLGTLAVGGFSKSELTDSVPLHRYLVILQVLFPVTWTTTVLWDAMGSLKCETVSRIEEK